jgi:hypothetical protein
MLSLCYHISDINVSCGVICFQRYDIPKTYDWTEVESILSYQSLVKLSRLLGKDYIITN